MHFQDLVKPFPGNREYYLPRKQALLKATAELRTKMAIAFATKNIDRQLARIDRQLEVIWASDPPPHTRRALIFALWDECEESPTAGHRQLEAQSEIDALRASAGAQARSRIIDFIRRAIPAESPDRFPEQDLRALNDKHASKERFDPYA